MKKKKCDFTRGMVCAAALVAKSEGRDSTFAREMLSYAGGVEKAILYGDVEDLEMLGLLPSQRLAARDGKEGA